MDANIDGGAIGLLSLDPLDVDPELAPVALHDLADLLALEVSTHNLDLIVLPHRHAPHAVLLPQLLIHNLDVNNINGAQKKSFWLKLTNVRFKWWIVQHTYGPSGR